MLSISDEFEIACQIKELLVARATGECDHAVDPPEYIRLRRMLINSPNRITRQLLPACVRNYRDLNEFWNYIQSQYPGYAARRNHIYQEFTPLLGSLEVIPIESEQYLFSILNTGNDWAHVSETWAKACARSTSDPEGAITAARTLMETVCKHILDDAEASYSETDSLPNLYNKASEQLMLTPMQHDDMLLKKILGNAKTVVDGLAELRNSQGDAHGRGRRSYRPSARHARMAVGLAGTTASFMMETWQERKTHRDSLPDTQLHA